MSETNKEQEALSIASGNYEYSLFPDKHVAHLLQIFSNKTTRSS